MAKENLMLYFRGAGVTDEDDDDGLAAGGAGNVTSLMVPASRLRGMVPGGSTSTLKMYFDSVKNYQGDAEQATEPTIADFVILDLVIADDVTTNVAGATVSAQYVSNHITGISANNIKVAVAHAGS